LPNFSKTGHTSSSEFRCRASIALLHFFVTRFRTTRRVFESSLSLISNAETRGSENDMDFDMIVGVYCVV
jgi:hypothetical protein